MTLGRIVLKSLRQHALSTAVTACSIALAAGLLMAVWAVKSQSQETFKQVTGGFDAVFGARSSKLQLVLNAVFHLEASPANIASKDFEAIRKHPAVALAVPIAMGDNFRGYRIVGTTPDMFAVRARPTPHAAPARAPVRPDTARGGRWQFRRTQTGAQTRVALPPLPWAELCGTRAPRA